MIRNPKRFRFRVNTADSGRLERLRMAGTHPSKSAVVKNALRIYASALSAQAEGFRLWYEHNGGQAREPYAASPATPEALGERHSVGILELRLAPREAQLLEILMGRFHAENASAAIRSAIRFLDDVSRQTLRGGRLVAVSRSGESFPVFPEEGRPLQMHEERIAVSAGNPARNETSPSSDDFSSLLPDSLWREIEELAAQERCSPHLLVVDLVRAGVAARNQGFTASIQDAFAQVSPEAAAHGESASERRHTAQTAETPPTWVADVPASLAPRSVQDGWALVVGEGQDGAPTGQLVTPDTVIPLDEDELRSYTT